MKKLILLLFQVIFLKFHLFVSTRTLIKYDGMLWDIIDLTNINLISYLIIVTTVLNMICILFEWKSIKIANIIYTIISLHHGFISICLLYMCILKNDFLLQVGNLKISYIWTYKEKLEYFFNYLEKHVVSADVLLLSEYMELKTIVYKAETLTEIAAAVDKFLATGYILTYPVVVSYKQMIISKLFTSSSAIDTIRIKGLTVNETVMYVGWFFTCVIDLTITSLFIYILGRSVVLIIDYFLGPGGGPGGSFGGEPGGGSAPSGQDTGSTGIGLDTATAVEITPKMVEASTIVKGALTALADAMVLGFYYDYGEGAGTTISVDIATLARLDAQLCLYAKHLEQINILLSTLPVAADLTLAEIEDYGPLVKLLYSPRMQVKGSIISQIKQDRENLWSILTDIDRIFYYKAMAEARAIKSNGQANQTVSEEASSDISPPPSGLGD